MNNALRNNAVDLTIVANRQRTLLWLILLSILSIIAMTFFFSILPLVGIAALIFLMLVQLLALVQTFRLSASMKSGYLMPILLIFGIFIPLLGLIMLLLISGQANGMLKASGVKIGLMGVPKSEYPKLKKGNCPGCGYSRDGLEPLQTCPECGRVPQIV